MIHIVRAYRWGGEDNHNYIVGVYSDYLLAKQAAEIEYVWRGCGKYICKILTEAIDPITEEKVDYWRNCLP